MTTPQQPTKRIRINVSRTSKGLYSHESTVEYEGTPLSQDGSPSAEGWLDICLEESAALVARLNAKYPVQEA